VEMAVEWEGLCDNVLSSGISFASSTVQFVSGSSRKVSLKLAM
jgi:hypothetical protein